MMDGANLAEQEQAEAGTIAGADTRQGAGRQRLVAAGSILGAIGASACCILPLALFMLGAGGAWMANLTALAPYQAIFTVITVGFLGYGFYLVYWKRRKAASVDGAPSVRILPSRLVKTSLWVATVLIVAAFTFPYYAPYILELL